MLPDKYYLQKIIRLSLAEDCAYNDVTSKGLGLKSKCSKASIISRQNGVVCGLVLIRPIFEQIGSDARIQIYKKDGDKVKPGEKVADIEGSSIHLFSAERLILNFLGRLSGIATRTELFARQVRQTKAGIFDTRKTTPCLRELEKYAVRCGGGRNHRMSLSDMVLVKDNHIASVNFDELQKAFRAWRHMGLEIEIEVENIGFLKKIYELKPDIIMLDNFSPALARRAADYIRKRRGRSQKPYIEISGNINLKNVKKYAGSGAERISIGSITHSSPNFDFSMEIL